MAEHGDTPGLRLHLLIDPLVLATKVMEVMEVMEVVGVVGVVGVVEQR